MAGTVPTLPRRTTHVECNCARTADLSFLIALYLNTTPRLKLVVLVVREAVQDVA
jgi:hypothetical protein